MNKFQEQKINRAVHFSEKKQQATTNFIAMILNHTLLKTESTTTLQTNIKYSYKNEAFFKTKVTRRRNPYYGFDTFEI